MKLFFTSILFFLFSFCVQAQIEKQIPKKPSPPQLVNDYTNTLTPAQAQALENKLVAYNDSTSTQLAIVIVPSLKGYDISEFALAIGREWGIGGKEFSNGAILLVAKDDRKVRIEVGYGLEGAVPDITAKSIIDNSITPHFKENNYYRGLDRAIDDIIAAAAGEYKAPQNYTGKKKGAGLGSIIAFIIVFLILGGLGGGRKGGSGGGGALSGAGWMILGNMLGNSSRGSGGWSGGSGGGGGGGFGGFGGGGFGGGGASGSW